MAANAAVHPSGWRGPNARECCLVVLGHHHDLEPAVVAFGTRYPSVESLDPPCLFARAPLVADQRVRVEVGCAVRPWATTCLALLFACRFGDADRSSHLSDVPSRTDLLGDHRSELRCIPVGHRPSPDVDHRILVATG